MSASTSTLGGRTAATLATLGLIAFGLAPVALATAPAVRCDGRDSATACR